MIDTVEFLSIQNNLAKRIRLEDRISIDSIKTFGGVDCTFVEVEGKTIGISCITIVDANFNIVEVVYGQSEVSVPYIPTFLAFREIPLIVEAYQKLKTIPDVFIFDGQGILHPRKMGIASHFGVLTDTVTVGCGKSPLYGRFDLPQNKPMSYTPVYVGDEVRGYCLRVKKNTNPIFISPGNNISVASSLYVIIKMIRGYKLPEPVRLSHNFLKEYRKKFIQEEKDEREKS